MTIVAFDPGRQTRLVLLRMELEVLARRQERENREREPKRLIPKQEGASDGASVK